MKKEYVKPVMDIVSFTTENIITASGVLNVGETGAANTLQASFRVINY
ncbi:MAG: hypothetical protein LUD81_05460 [Clostridiales bacterium]|nr:hypothetical protein [Clostridiales bacterium]